MEMKFTFSPLVLLALLFASSFAAPTEKASSKRALKFSFSGYEYGAVGIRDVETNADEYRLSKRVQFGRDSLVNISDSPISLKRSTEEADEEFSKRSKTYNLVASSLSPVNGHSDRSTDAYEGRRVVVYMSDAMVHGLERNGVTQDQMHQYLSQAVHATDPATGYKYYLVPNEALATTAADISEAFAREP
ncbi:hypothetical protein HD554DRAFT_2040500 [Boletus coccyginus]|nr:hypothetical protein HD554DRAFT_2040500 [Boletus coccyginus]